MGNYNARCPTKSVHCLIINRKKLLSKFQNFFQLIRKHLNLNFGARLLKSTEK